MSIRWQERRPRIGAPEHLCQAPEGPTRFTGRVTRLRGDGPPPVVATPENLIGPRQAEESLREGEEGFRQLTENIRDIFWMTDIADSPDALHQPRLRRNLGANLPEPLRKTALLD